MIWCAQQEQRSAIAVSLIGEDGTARTVATLAAAGTIAMTLDAARERAAVLAGRHAWIVDGDGHTTELGQVAEVEEAWARPELAWLQDGRVDVVGSETSSREFVLPDDWRLEVSGDVEADGGFSGGHTASTGSYERGTSVHVRLCRGRIAIDADVEAGEATTTLMWPPVVGPRGVLLRRARSFASPGGGTTIQAAPPWLATPLGVLLELPVELGVSPLAALPDGTWLLPGASPLWRDDLDEPLHVMDDQGRLTAYRATDTEVRPSSLIETHAPEWAETREQREAKGEAVWSFEQARVDTASNELRVLLTDVELSTSDAEPLRWLAMALPLDGPGAARVLKRGAHADASRIAISV